MNRIAAFVLSFALVAPSAFAHGGNEHVRGTVKEVSAQSITVQTSAKATKTLTLSDKTTYKIAGAKGGAAKLSDVAVGDRVVIDVPEGSTEALEVQIGKAPAAVKK